MGSRGPCRGSALPSSPSPLLLQTVVQNSMTRSQVALLGLGLLFMLLLYVGLPGPPEQTSWLWGDPNVTILAGLTPGSSPIFYREVLPLHWARRWVLTPGCSGRTRPAGSPCVGPPAQLKVLRAWEGSGRSLGRKNPQNTHSPVCPQGGCGAAPWKGL